MIFQLSFLIRFGAGIPCFAAVCFDPAMVFVSDNDTMAQKKSKKIHCILFTSFFCRLLDRHCDEMFMEQNQISRFGTDDTILQLVYSLPTGRHFFSQRTYQFICCGSVKPVYDHFRYTKTSFYLADVHCMVFDCFDDDFQNYHGSPFLSDTAAGMMIAVLCWQFIENKWRNRLNECT